MKIPLFGQTGTERVDDVSYQLTQNWYPHITKESKSAMVLYPTPGLTVFADIAKLPTGPVRGMSEYGDELYVVSNSGFYKVNAAAQYTLLGTLSTSSGRVSMAHNGSKNGKQIAIVDGTDLWIYDSSDASFTEITQFNDASTALFTATHIAFMDSYFITNDTTNSGRFYISAGYDGADWDTLDFATAERSPDELQALVVSDLTLVLVGTKTTERWFNSGATDFPFAPMQSGFNQYGTVAPSSVVEVAGTVLYLAQNEEGVGQVLMTKAAQTQIVSTLSIAAEISRLTTLTDAYAWSYQYQQHTFYVLTFPTDGRTFVFDLSTQMWHEWKTESTGYHRSNNHIYVYGKHLIGDPLNGKIYELAWGNYTDNSERIVRLRRSAPINADDVSLRHYAVHIDIKEGVGNDDVTNPKIHLRWRDNNGAWSNYYTRSMGEFGDRSLKVVWRRLGRTRERVYEIRVTDPCNAVLIDAYGVVTEDSREIG